MRQQADNFPINTIHPAGTWPDLEEIDARRALRDVSLAIRRHADSLAVPVLTPELMEKADEPDRFWTMLEIVEAVAEGHQHWYPIYNLEQACSFFTITIGALPSLGDTDFLERCSWGPTSEMAEVTKMTEVATLKQQEVGWESTLPTELYRINAQLDPTKWTWEQQTRAGDLILIALRITYDRRHYQRAALALPAPHRGSLPPPPAPRSFIRANGSVYGRGAGKSGCAYDLSIQ